MPTTIGVQIYAYQYRADFVISCIETPLDIENAIIDKLRKGDIKWEYLGEMMIKIKRITYEEVINGGDNATSRKSILSEEGSGSRMGAGAS